MLRKVAAQPNSGGGRTHILELVLRNEVVTDGEVVEAKPKGY